MRSSENGDFYRKLVYTHRYLADHKIVCVGSHFIHMQTDSEFTKKKRTLGKHFTPRVKTCPSYDGVHKTGVVLRPVLSCLTSTFVWVVVFMSLSTEQQLLHAKEKKKASSDSLNPSHRT